MKLLIFAVLVVVQLYADTDVCSSVPPTLWCGNSELEKKCDFKAKCENYRTAVKNKPVELTLLMEGLCGGCQAFITEILYPKIFQVFGDFVKIEIVPFGNAKIQDGGIVCQHGEDECRINMFESCLIDATQDQKQYVPMIYCLEKQLKEGTAFEDASAKCFETLQIGFDIQRLIQSCLVSRLGKQLQAKAGERTASVWPEQHKHVPWILFNNVSLSSAQLLHEDIPTLICQWYEGDQQIPYCRQQQKLLKRKSSNWNYFLQDFFF